MAKTFVTIFTPCENVHLTKDLGQIPYFLHQRYGYNSKMVCYKNSESYPNSEGEVKGLKLEFIKNSGRISFIEKGIIKYLFKNAKKIDVLNLYIYSKYSFVYGVFYKLLNPKGYLYLKLDGYNETFEKEHEIVHSIKKTKNTILKNLEKRFLKKVDLISIENSEGELLVKAKFPTIANKIMYLPVGVNDLYLKELFDKKIKPYHKKENIILTSGRIGEWIKNHEMILRALTKVEMADWKMVFMGPVNEDFLVYYTKLIADYPALKDQIIFTGAISDRKEIYDWYNRSKIFCITSVKESFCHAVAEALYFGNYIIGTEGVMSIKDISKNGMCGSIIKPNDDVQLASEIQRLINDQSTLEKLYPSIITHSCEHFVWSKIIVKLEQQLKIKD